MSPALERLAIENLSSGVVVIKDGFAQLLGQYGSSSAKQPFVLELFTCIEIAPAVPMVAGHEGSFAPCMQPVTCRSAPPSTERLASSQSATSELCYQ
jgi:hypothetical protein